MVLLVQLQCLRFDFFFIGNVVFLLVGIEFSETVEFPSLLLTNIVVFEDSVFEGFLAGDLAIAEEVDPLSQTFFHLILLLGVEESSTCIEFS